MAKAKNADYDPMSTAGDNRAKIGDNSAGAEKETALKLVVDLYEEIANWCDGTPIENETQHDAITALRKRLHDAGAVVEAMRVVEKQPHDDAIKVIQEEFNPYVQKDKGKVDKGKKAVDKLTTAWRVKVAEEQAKEASRLAEESRKAVEAAQERIRSTGDNLLERDDAEEELKEARQFQREANREVKGAGKGLGLVTVTTVTIDEKNMDAAMNWAFDYNSAKFYELAEAMALDHVKINSLDALKGFVVKKDKVARG